MMKLIWSIGAASALGLAQGTTIYEATDGSTLRAAIDAAQLAGVLNSTTSNFTVFAPSDEAFEKIEGIVAHLLTDNAYQRSKLQDVLKVHVLAGSKLSTDLGTTEPTLLEGQSLTLDLGSDPASITAPSPAVISGVDTELANGVVHNIDDVIVPADFETRTIAELAGESLVAALVQAELATLFSQPQNGTAYTVFAPSDAAFSTLLSALGLSLEEVPKDVLTSILTAHVVGTPILSANVADEPYINTLGGPLAVTQLQAALDTDALDIMALNGIVHGLNKVLLPTIFSTVAGDSDLSTLATAVGAADLSAALSDTNALTVFAPTNEAFAKIQSIVAHLVLPNAYNKQLLTTVLLHHVVAGNKKSTDLGATETTLAGTEITVADVKLNTVDIFAGNATVHKVNDVLVPAGAPLSTIASFIANSPDHTTLTLALNAASLVPTFTNPAAAGNSWTVFAPTDAAFAAALKLTGLSLAELAQDAETLQTILQAHVVNTAVSENELKEAGKVTTLGGEEIPLSSISVSSADNANLNGYVHVLDAVIVPPSLASLIKTTAPTSSAARVAAGATLVLALIAQMF